VRNETGTAAHLRTTREAYQPPATWQVNIPVPESCENQHLAVLGNFIRAILHGEELIAPAKEGLNSLELINGIQLASFKDRTVEIPISAAEYAAFLRDRIASSRIQKKTRPYRGAPGNYLSL